MSEVNTVLGPVPSSELNKWELVIHYMNPILEYFIDPTVTDIMVNSYNNIFIEGLDGRRSVSSEFSSESDLRQFIEQLAVVLGQDDPNLQILHARFPDQSRACCTMSGVTPIGSSATIRCAPKSSLTFKDLVSYNSLNLEMRDYLCGRVKQKDNIIVSGSTGSGKTTLIRALAEFIPDSDRVLTCEDTNELFLDLKNQIVMEAPKRKDSDITLSTLIETTLRQGPDRVIVGEIRDAYACDAFLQVINTGHGGCCTSIHANNPDDAIRRIQYLLAKEGLIGFELAAKEVRNSVNLVVQTARTDNGKRITHISSVQDDHLVQIFGYDEVNDSHFRLE